MPWKNLEVYIPESFSDEGTYENTTIERAGNYGVDDVITIARGGKEIILYHSELQQLLEQIGFGLVPLFPDLWEKPED
jgi:hypothetical protein